MKIINQSQPLVWRKSSRCSSESTCVEVASLASGEIAVRDSKQKSTSPILVFTPTEWDAFLQGAKAGEFDR